MIRIMKKILSILAVTSLALGLTAFAEEKTIETTATCAKCDLGETSKCQDVVKIEGKWLELTGEGAKGFHPKICKSAKQVAVTGEVKDNKFVASKIELK